MAPVFSQTIMSFIKERGFKEFTPPQREAIPYILCGRNVLIVAPTGTGKTEAAILPILEKMLQSRERGKLRVLYITPLRALNRDILERISWWFRKADFRVAVRHGDTTRQERVLQTVRVPDVLVTTPETFQLVFIGKRLRSLLRDVKWVIVDEVHEIASSKRGSQLAILLEKLRKVTGGIQVIGLSATIGNPEKAGLFLAGSSEEIKVIYVPVAKLFKIRVVYPNPSEEDYKVAEKLGENPEVIARIRFIHNVLENVRSAMIFTNTRPTAELLVSRFKILYPNFPILVHHGSLSREKREEAERFLKEGIVKALICTSSMELGIDIGHIDLVILYNSPRQVARLIQRVGRSGHKIGRVSKGVVVALGSNDALEALVLKSFLKREKIEPIQIYNSPLDVLAHELVGVLIVEKRINIKDFYNFVKLSYPYKGLKYETLMNLINFLKEIKIVKVFNEYVTLGDKEYVYKYFYGNLSMILELNSILL